MATPSTQLGVVFCVVKSPVQIAEHKCENRARTANYYKMATETNGGKNSVLGTERRKSPDISAFLKMNQKSRAETATEICLKNEFCCNNHA